MTPPNPLQKLRDLDRTSPHFHDQLINFLRGNEYQNVALNLQGEDLAWLVDYLGNVSLHFVFPRPALTASTGPLRSLQSQKCPTSGTTRRTQKAMRSQECAPKHVHTFRFAFGMCI